MQGKEAIISKILSDAEALARSITDEARQKMDNEIFGAETLAGDYKKTRKEKIAAEAEAIISRKKSAAEIEVKKQLLQKKQDIITRLFDDVESKIKNDAEKYRNFLYSLTEKYCENGDTVLVGKEDKDIFTVSAVNDIASKKGITLKYGISDSLKGGIILRSDYYDKNLSVAALLGSIKEEDITRISEILFGAEK